MRSVSAILLASVLFCATASAQNHDLPGATLDEAGQAAGFAQFLCNVPGDQTAAFRKQVDLLTSGGTGSAEFLEGEARSRKVIAQSMQDGGNGNELRASACPESAGIFERTLTGSTR